MEKANRGQIRSAKDLIVYQTAFELGMEVFEISKRFPKEEEYSLTDQICRSAPSVCGNVREAWPKRRYEARFVSKLTDADGENGETDTWLDLAAACEYLSESDHFRLTEMPREVGAMLGKMILNPHPFIHEASR